MRSLEYNKLLKYIPENILSTLAYIDYETFPFDFEKISDKEMLRILHHFLRTGKNMEEIKKSLLEIIDKKENELYVFVKNYNKTGRNLMVETFIMIFLGFFIAFGIYKASLLIIN